MEGLPRKNGRKRKDREYLGQKSLQTLSERVKEEVGSGHPGLTAGAVNNGLRNSRFSSLTGETARKEKDHWSRKRLKAALQTLGHRTEGETSSGCQPKGKRRRGGEKGKRGK